MRFKRGIAIKKTFALLVCSLACGVFSLPLSSQKRGSSEWRTGVRFLKLAEKYLEAEDYKTADETADMGISYCKEISDLWYVKALASSKLGGTRASVLMLSEKALNEGVWTDYNKDDARLLYASTLCDVGRYDEVLPVLDEPYMSGADAQYIRAKTYYRMSTAQSIEAARRKVDDCRKMYKDDERFALLFFSHERALRMAGVEASDEAEKIASAFIAHVYSYKECSARLFLLCAMMAKGDEKARMLNAFSANEMQDILYAQAALEEGIMSCEEAADYFFDFADSAASLEDMKSFIAALSLKASDEVKASVKEHLDSYEGLLTEDTTGDLEPNLFVKYFRGRPIAINYDADSDGLSEWVAKCDYGVPISIEAGGHGKRLKTDVSYGVYPWVSSVTLVSGKVFTLNLVENKYQWSPFEMERVEEWQKDYGAEVFVPRALKDIPNLDIDAIVAAARQCTMPIDEREGASVEITMLDGLRQTVDYIWNGKVYAKGTYIDGLPSVRVIDSDGNGIFETTERYSKARKKTDKESIEEYPFTDDVYISRIEVDLNEDTVIGFAEEYTEDGGKVSIWDHDGDGQWDVRYSVRTTDGNVTEEKAYFFVPPKREAVCVECLAGEPVEVTAGETSVAVLRGQMESMYWIREAGSFSDETAVSSLLNGLPQGVSVLAENKGRRIFAVRIGEKSYASIVRDEAENADNDNESNSSGSVGDNVQDENQ